MTTVEMITAKKFREDLQKIMPGYSWTVHKTTRADYLEATGTTSSGMNRTSTISVVVKVGFYGMEYTVKSAGFGLRAEWLAKNEDSTLARAFRGLQKHYEMMANTYRGHAAALEAGRQKPKKGE